VALEPFVTDGHGQRDQGLDHLRAELVAQPLRVDGRLLLEPAPDLEPHHRVGQPGAGSAGETDHVLAIAQRVSGDRRHERHLHFLDARVVVGRNGDADVPLLPQALRQLLLADGVDDLLLDGPAADVVLGERKVGDEQQMVHRGLGRERQDASEKLPIELAVGHERSP